MKYWLVDDRPAVPGHADARCRMFWRPRETDFPAIEGSLSVAVMSVVFCILFSDRRLMTLRVLSAVSETAATSTAGTPSAVTRCLPLGTAGMIPSTAWIPLARVPGRRPRQM